MVFVLVKMVREGQHLNLGKILSQCLHKCSVCSPEGVPENSRAQLHPSAAIPSGDPSAALGLGRLCCCY